ncbi:MAG: Holliday junction resolvase RecU [Bacilli bacterium]|jgi:recombination protein U|nr:Holliday junction resolvase RecU [Bacilli bacterium]
MINYPTTKKIAHQKDSFSNRGMSLEKELNLSNEYYLRQGIANIHKKPTPIQVVQVSYPKRQAAKIIEAYYQKPSTTDYNGLYQGKYIDFEAKETKHKNKFIYTNIHTHQREHLQSIIELKGIAFFIIRFSCYNETYLIEATIILESINNNEKSISYAKIKEVGYLIKENYRPRLDYLRIVDIIINKE